MMSNNLENNKESFIKILEDFKILIKKYSRTDYTSNNKNTLRKQINQSKNIVEKIINRAGVGKLMRITPPPLLGGYVYQNVNPFNVIFDPPYGVDVTNPIIDCIDEAIGIIKASTNFTIEPVAKKNSNSPTNIDTKSVFIVHGHDHSTKEEVARFIEKIGLKPIILHEQVNQGLTIIEKFEKHSNTFYAIVLMTPDDLGNTLNNRKALNQRARQNVIFELGYFFGRLGRKKVCALLKGNIERPSDSDGILYIALDNEGGWKLPLVKELKAAELDFDSNKVFD